MLYYFDVENFTFFYVSWDYSWTGACARLEGIAQLPVKGNALVVREIKAHDANTHFLWQVYTIKETEESPFSARRFGVDSR